MKLLFDQNLAPSLVERLSDIFPFSDHVHRIGFDEAEDLSICQYALEHGFAVVTKDGDYEQLALRLNSPHIVWVKRGNCSTSQIERLIRGHSEQILAFGVHATARLLILI